MNWEKEKNCWGRWLLGVWNWAYEFLTTVREIYFDYRNIKEIIEIQLAY